MRLIDADMLIDRMYHDAFETDTDMQKWDSGCWIRYKMFENAIDEQPTIEPKQEWIPCSEKLPKINQNVLLSTTNGTVFVGHRDKPDLIWQVTESDGRKHWVYDPEAYTDDVDALPKGEDCGFSTNTDYADGFTSVTSLNYDDRFIGVNAWMPLPKPWKGEADE